MKKLLAVMLAAVMALCMVTAAAEAYTFAVIGPITGAAAIYGSAVVNGCQIAADEINAAAGEEVIKLIIADDTHDAEIAMNAYNDALDNHAQAISAPSLPTPASLFPPRPMRTAFSC